MYRDYIRRREEGNCDALAAQPDPFERLWAAKAPVIGYNHDRCAQPEICQAEAVARSSAVNITVFATANPVVGPALAIAVIDLLHCRRLVAAAVAVTVITLPPAASAGPSSTSGPARPA